MEGRTDRRGKVQNYVPAIKKNGEKGERGERREKREKRDRKEKKEKRNGRAKKNQTDK